MSEQDPNERKDLLAAVSDDGANANLLLVWRKAQDEYACHRVQMDEDLATEFMNLVQEAARDLLEERHLVAYDPEWPLGDHQFFAIPNDPPVGGNLFVSLADYANLPWFKKANLTKPSLYVVAVWTQGGVAFFGKRMSQLQVLGRRNKVLGLTWDGSVFHELHGSVATFARDFDWILWPNATGTMYVVNAAGFHAQFRDTAELRAAVDGHVLRITEKIAIENAGELAERCRRSVPMASKLKRVVEDGILDWPIAELRKYGEERGIAVVWSGDALVFDGSIEGQWNILKLLDEDRTEGPVSGRTYESSSKRKIS